MSSYDELVSDVGSVFASSWWLDAVAPGRWRPHAIEEHGVTVAAWPTVVRRTRWGEVHEGARLTPFLGPLMRLPEQPVRHWAEQLRLLEALLSVIGPSAALDARCHPAFEYWTPLLWNGFSQTTSYTWRLDDLSNTEAVFAGARENIRREVRKAAKRGITVSMGSLDELLAVHAHTVDQQQIGDADGNRAILRRADQAAAPRDARSILIARDAEGRVHAGAYLVHDARYTYYLIGGSDAGLRNSGAMSAVMWAAIELAAARGTGFDFEGSALRSVERYFRAFGGRPVACSRVRRTWSRGLAAEVAAKRTVRSATRRVTSSARSSTRGS
ncbi:MAG: GNAT family N-acetyltransferase [Gaiellales bacterium]